MHDVCIRQCCEGCPPPKSMWLTADADTGRRRSRSAKSGGAVSAVLRRLPCGGKGARRERICDGLGRNALVLCPPAACRMTLDSTLIGRFDPTRARTSKSPLTPHLIQAKEERMMEAADQLDRCQLANDALPVCLCL